MKRDDLHKVTLNLRAGDPERLREIHPELSYGAVIRQLVADYIERKEREAARETETVVVKL